MAGRPKGALNKDKPFAEALRMQISKAGANHKKLREIADKLLACAAAGDMQAIQQVADRLDGKPSQAIEHSGEVQHYVADVPAVAQTVDTWQQQHAPKTLQ